MTVAFTQIVGVESDQNRVIIQFRPQGSDSADAPLRVQVNPHSTHLYLNLSGAEFEQGGANNLTLKFTPR